MSRELGDQTDYLWSLIGAVLLRNCWVRMYGIRASVTYNLAGERDTGGRDGHFLTRRTLHSSYE